MMIQTMTWQTFLDDHFHRLRADEKQAFAAQVGVSIVTINRWRRRKDCPNAGNLERMLLAFSERQRQRFLVLLKNDPKMWPRVPTSIQNAHPLLLIDEQVGLIDQFDILDHFCLKMLRLQRDTPDRFWQLSSAVLREMVTQMETHPVRTGMEVLIAKCMPPKNGKVRSLRMLVGVGTHPWREDVHFKECFLGATDLAGYAIASRHGEMIPDFTQRYIHFPLPVHSIEDAGSAAAFPIMQKNGIAGVLQVSSMQPQYFTQERLELLEIFADLIRLAFYDESDFYPYAHIDLGIMPPLHVQQIRFTAFWQRVEAKYWQMSHNEDASMREMMQVEDKVREQIEDDFLKIAASTQTFAM